jgi:hypothetical protein
MERGRGALEVWLKGEKDVLVGWLTDFAPFDHKRTRITITLSDWTPDDNPFEPLDDVVTEHAFDLQVNTINRDHALILNEGLGPRSWFQKNVPIGAHHLYFEHSNVDRYSWKVLAVDMDDYEFLFDLPTFEAFEPKSKAPLTDDEFDASAWAAMGRGSEAVLPVRFPLLGVDPGKDESFAWPSTWGARREGKSTATDMRATYTITDKEIESMRCTPLIEPDYLEILQEEMNEKITRSMLYGDFDGH